MKDASINAFSKNFLFSQLFYLNLELLSNLPFKTMEFSGLRKIGKFAVLFNFAYCLLFLYSEVQKVDHPTK